MLSNRARLFENFFNVSHKVLGYRLEPFALLHYQFLEQIESPLVITSKPVAETDLRLAALVCSCKSQSEILEKLESQGKWWKKLLAPRVKNLESEVKRFLAYMDDYLSLPDMQETDGAPTIEKLPWFLLAAASLIRATGWSEETVWRMPLGKVLWYGYTFNYLETGKTNILSDVDRAAEEALAMLASA